jgi:hypothetical protein
MTEFTNKMEISLKSLNWKNERAAANSSFAKLINKYQP